MSSSDRLFNQLPEILFGDIVELLSEKVSSSEITLQNYISTENMIPNCGGVVKASSLPKATKFNSFYESDTLFSNIRTYFRKVWSAEFSGGASADVLIFRSKDRFKLDPRFLYYLVSNKEFVDFTDRTSKGAKMPRGDKDAIVKYPLHLPSVDEQKAIASVLGALDDKIENNRRMNETLEEMARAIFKSWFVDFDPVHAKAAGNAPAHMDAETAALFPSSFGDDGLPVGWEEEHLPNLIDFKEGPGLRNWQYTNSDEGVRFINIRCIKNKDLELTTANRVTDLEAYGKYAHFLLEAGDIVVSTSGTLGRFSFVREEHLPLMLNTSVIRMRPIPAKSTREFLYAYLGSKEFQNELEIRATGSAQKNFGPMHLNQMHVKVPKFEIINAYSQKTSPIFGKFLSNQKENQTLAELRDTLLPKLMSGEIRVADVEREVEAAV